MKGLAELDEDDETGSNENGEEKTKERKQQEGRQHLTEVEVEKTKEKKMHCDCKPSAALLGSWWMVEKC